MYQAKMKFVKKTIFNRSLIYAGSSIVDSSVQSTADYILNKILGWT